MNKKKRPDGRILFLALFGCLATGVFAQSNSIIDSVLAEGEASFGKSVYLVLTAANLIPESATVTEAITKLQTFKWNIKTKSQDNPITLGEYALLLMQAFKSQGGFMYALFRNDRYAGRELVYRGWIQGSTSPYRTISGDEALNLLSYMVALQESQEIKAQESQAVTAQESQKESSQKDAKKQPEKSTKAGGARGQ